MTNPIITAAVRALVDRRDLTRLEAAAAMEAIMSGAATNAQIAAGVRWWGGLAHAARVSPVRRDSAAAAEDQVGERQHAGGAHRYQSHRPDRLGACDVVRRAPLQVP